MIALWLWSPKGATIQQARYQNTRHPFFCVRSAVRVRMTSSGWRLHGCLLVSMLVGCHKAPSDSSDSPIAYQAIYDGFDSAGVLEFVKNLTGYNPVTVDGQTLSLTERFSIEGKAKWRSYFRQYFTALGLVVNAIDYESQHLVTGESQGHDLEAVLPGQSDDSVVIVVHYDSRGEALHNDENPAVDDDMTGMATMFETARLLAPLADKLHHTIRFAAVDYEEWPWPYIEGSTQYVQYLTQLATQQNFQIVAAIDDEQSGWNCFEHDACPSITADTVDISSSSDDGTYAFPVLGSEAVAVAAAYSPLSVFELPSHEHSSDHFSFWAAGIPAIQISEHLPFLNPHYDIKGGDTWDVLDQAYYLKISRLAVTVAAKIAGLDL